MKKLIHLKPENDALLLEVEQKKEEINCMKLKIEYHEKIQN
jgi:hypothetical protein